MRINNTIVISAKVIRNKNYKHLIGAMISRRMQIILAATITFLLLATLVAILVLLLQKETNEGVAGCEILPFEMDTHPIVVLSKTSSFLYPERNDKILKFTAQTAVDFICPGSTILSGGKDLSSSLLTGTCNHGTFFKVGDTQVDWRNLSCSNSLWRSIRNTGNNCAGNGIEQETGFEVSDGRFLRTLLICFNPTKQIAYYTYIHQTASINQRVLNTPRPSWLQGSDMYSIGTVTNLYFRNKQRSTINALVGLPMNSTKYIQTGTDYFLSRGHLTARSDNYYAAQQNATFFMQNIAPQWQTFNGYNWNQIEIDVRDYASDNGVDLQVWTGVHGVATLPHEQTGKPVELYLTVNSTTKALPVPEIFWKIAYNPLTQRGLALIGVNNPYDITFKPICNDVSSRIKWLHCDRKNQTLGFCYACSITTLRHAVTSIPNITDRGLLL